MFFSVSGPNSFQKKTMRVIGTSHFLLTIYLYFPSLFPGFATCAHLFLLLSPHALSEMVPRKAFEGRRGQAGLSPTAGYSHLLTGG